MGIGDIASLIAAIAFLILVLVLAVPLIRLGNFFGSLTKSVHELTKETLPTIRQTSQTMTSVNAQMEKIDEVTSSAQRAVQDVSALTTLTSATIGKPLIKISAFSYATRKALNLVAKNGEAK